jgi:hypothetical protein
MIFAMHIIKKLKPHTIVKEVTLALKSTLSCPTTTRPASN